MNYTNSSDKENNSANPARLSEETLAKHPSRLTVPTYDRKALKPGIVHLGVGSFHRAHQAMYLDELAQQGISLDWGEWGVGLHSRNMKEALAPQNWLYTLLERSAQEDKARVIGAMQHYLFALEEGEAVLEALASEQTRLVTLTITKDGYPIDLISGDFKAEEEEVQDELSHADNPDTVLGYLCEALERRRKNGLAPFTILSCDNLQDNGGAARTALVSFAHLRDEKLGRWIEENVAFPSSMVDRITPQTTSADRELVASTFGLDDHWPVVAEPFSQWIIQDTFSNGRPPLEEVGVQFVTDIHPYERMKTRLLNASHSAIGYLGYLAGYRTSAEAMADPLIYNYLSWMMEEEVMPLLPPVQGIDLMQYKRTLLERFANPKVGDKLERLCARGSSKLPTFVLPSIKEASEARRPHGLLDLAVAAWLRYLRGIDDNGEKFEIVDPRKDHLQELVMAGENDPRPVLAEYEVFDELGRSEDFAASLQQLLRRLEASGVKGTLSAWLSDRAA
jgi:fructuronate reductase/mannitol 2-dehydrogenase